MNQENIEDIQQNAYEYAKTKSTQEVLNYLYDNISKYQLPYRDLILLERRYNRLMEEKEEQNSPENFIRESGRIDIALMNTIDNLDTSQH